jgi:hypothetical protein
MLCGISKQNAAQYCFAGIWDGIKPELKCPACDALYEAAQTERVAAECDELERKIPY